MCIFIFDCVGSSLLHGLFSSCGEQGLIFIAVGRLLIAVAFLVAEHGIYSLWASAVAVCRLQNADSIVVVHGLRCSKECVGSFWTRDRTCVSSIGRWIFYPWATREAPKLIHLFSKFSLFSVTMLRQHYWPFFLLFLYIPDIANLNLLPHRCQSSLCMVCLLSDQFFTFSYSALYHRGWTCGLYSPNSWVNWVGFILGSTGIRNWGLIPTPMPWEMSPGEMHLLWGFNFHS